jgi:hypothetical protein
VSLGEGFPQQPDGGSGEQEVAQMVGADEGNRWGADKRITPSQLQGPGQIGYEAQEKQADLLVWCFHCLIVF